ncbi:hypothetical protein G7054_g8477 [Neopestalotiopsis clavispora]|nr:hypothetical protein G7054_g8477 [Neopestalotiopsis clavispora]
MRSFLVLKAATAVILGTQSTLAQNWDGVPTTGKVVNGVQYLGCPVEIPGRVLTGVSYSDDAMTIESCAAYCTKNNLPLFGVEYGRECYCGRYIPPTVNMPGKAGDCNMNCKNNKASLSKQMCGGVNRMSVFNVTTFAGPGAIKNNADWGYMSCFMEPQWGRALSNLVKPDDKMTINMCFDTCKAGGYSYAGLEYGRECWCGNTVAPNLEDASDPACAMQCDMVCGGNSGQMCGGRGAISLYQRNNKKRDHVDIYEGHHGGPSEVDLNVAARKGRFVRVRRPSVRRAQREEREQEW